MDTTTLSPSPAKVETCAPRATRGAWHRRRHTSPITSSRVCRCASGCCRCPSDCAIFCNATVQAEPAITGLGAPGLAPLGNAAPIQPEPAEPVPPKRSPAHYLWAVLIARIYEVFPLLCRICGGQMRLIAFITHSADIRQILDHIGVDTEPPHLSPARGPPMWDDRDAQMDDAAQIESD